MIHDNILSLIYEISNEKFLEIQRLVSWKSLSRASTDANKREEFTIELLNKLDGEKLQWDKLPNNLINYIDRQFIPKLDHIIDFDSTKNLSTNDIKKLITNFKMLKDQVIDSRYPTTQNQQLEVDFMNMYIFNILKQNNLDKYQSLDFGPETQAIISDIVSHSKLQFSNSLSSAMDIIQRSESEREFITLANLPKPIPVSTIAEPSIVSTPIAIPTTVPISTIAEPPIVSTPIAIPAPITPITNLIPSTLETQVTNNSLLSKFNVEIPEWVSDIPNDKLSVLIGGGLVALFGIVSSAYVGTRLFKLIYGKFSKSIDRQLHRKYGIDIVLGLTIIDLLFDTWENPAIQKEFRNNRTLYLNNLYSKYNTLLYIINNLNVGYKAKLITDIRSGEFALLFSDMIVDFQLRRENSNDVVSKLLSNSVNSSSQFIKLLT